MKRSLLIGLAMFLAACGALGAAKPTPTPVFAYVALYPNANPNNLFFIEVTTQAALTDLLKPISGFTAVQLSILPAGSAISCQKRDSVDGSKITVWDDGKPASRTLAQELCNRLP